MHGASSEVKREHSRPSWWVPSREGSAADMNSPLKKQKFQAKKPTRYTPGAGLVPAEAPVSSLTPTIQGVSGVSQSSLPLPLPAGPTGPLGRPLSPPAAPTPGRGRSGGPNCTTARRPHTDQQIVDDKLQPK